MKWWPSYNEEGIWGDITAGVPDFSLVGHTHVPSEVGLSNVPNENWRHH